MFTASLALVAACIFGTIIGSFLNVVILRMNTGKGVAGRSICFSCGTTLRAFELIPLVSFFAQKGKCRACDRNISWQYPLVEMLTGFIFAGIMAALYAAPVTLIFSVGYFMYYGIIFSILIIIAGYDTRHKIIPDSAVYAFIALAMFSPLFGSPLAPYFDSVWIDHIVAGILLALPFALIWLASRGRLMGLGDAKLALGMGFLLGLSYGVAAVMLAFWIGAAVGVGLLLLKRTTLTIKSELPFAPFLIAGTGIAFFFHVGIPTLAKLFQWS